MAHTDEINMKNQKNIRQFILEVGALAVSRYSYLDTVGYGMVKQMGRWARAQLKFKQSKKTGHDTCIHRIANRKAIGDCLIFLMNWCFIKNINLSLEEAMTFTYFNRKKHDLIPVGLILASIAQIFMMHESMDDNDPILRRPYAQRIFNNLALLAELMGEDVMYILNHRWQQISK